MEDISDGEMSNTNLKQNPSQEGSENIVTTAPPPPQNNIAVEAVEDPMDKCPPDFEWAKKHGNANMVKNLDVRNTISKDLDDDNMYCPCCRLPTDKAAPKYKLCVSVLALEDLGAGFPLYYQFKIFTIIIYAIMFAFVGIAGLIINTDQEKGAEWVGPGEEVAYIVEMSIGNHGALPEEYDDQSIVAEQILNFIFIFVIIIGSIILRHFQSKVINDIDEKNLTPSDFGVMVTNLPLNKTQDEVRDWLKTFFEDLDIVYINYCYDIGDIVKVVRRITKLQEMRSYVQYCRTKKLNELGMDEAEAESREIDLHPPKERYCCCMTKKYATIEVLNEAISKSEKELEKIKNEMDVNTEKDLYCGTAFIVLNKQSHAQKLEKYFEVPLITRAYSFLIYDVFRCKNSKVNNRYWDGNRVYVERAAEPTDIYWENLSVSFNDRVKKSFQTYMITFVCLLIAFGITYGVSVIKEQFDSEGETTTFEELFIRIISILTSFLVVVINVILGRVIRLLSAYEKHETYSKYHLSVAVKLTMALFINSGITPLFVNYGREDWFDSGGLMVDIFYNTLSLCFVSPFAYLFNPVHLVKKCKQRSEVKKGEDSKLTQRQANHLFEGPPLDMAQRYANTMLLFLMTVFYVYPMPIMPLLTMCGVGFQYWVEKYILLRRHKLPEQMGSTMAEVFSNMIPFFCFIYGISLLTFSNILSEGDNSLIGLIAFIITLGYFFLPIRFLIKK